MMKRMSIFILLLTGFCIEGCDTGITVANNGSSEYRIVVSDTSSPSTVYGAGELQKFLEEMTGAEIPIIFDLEPMTDREIIIGNNSHLQKLNQTIDFDELGDEGYVLRTVGKHIIIAGGELRGNMYGVYGLLEDHLGCRWFTPEITRIPRYSRLSIPKLNEKIIPVLEYREPFIWDAIDGDWAARNRINRNTFRGRLEERHGGQVEWVPGFFAHTFEKLVPKAKYYDTHPEYFSLVSGVRMREMSQLCCTNEDVVRIVTEGVLKAFRENPRAKILSIGQNDFSFNYCECENCQEIAEREGAQIAPVLRMVNRVADEVKKYFPDRSIVTFAYQWTRHAPQTMKPRDNVIIRLCSIECCFTHPFDRCDNENNISFTKDLEEWSKVSKRMWVWNYTTDFSHYLLPFPNLRILNDNLKLFVEHNVTGIFQQDTPNIRHGEFSELGAYLQAKLLWNPDYDEDTAIDEFLDAYYGDAAPQMMAYLDFIHDKAEKENIHMICYEPPETRLLDDDYFAFSDSIWAEAEKAVAGRPEYLERVQASRLSPEYAFIARDMNEKAYLVDQETLSVDINPAYIERLENCGKKAERFGVAFLNERGLTFEKFRNRITETVSDRKLAFMEPVNVRGLSPGISYIKYASGWKDKPVLSSASTGMSEQILLPDHSQNKLSGMVFEGYLGIPRDGVYSLYTYSDDGSMLYIDGKEIVDNGGHHTMQERVGFAALRKGMHSLKITWFKGVVGSGLDVFIKGPGMEKQRIPASMIFHKKK